MWKVLIIDDNDKNRELLIETLIDAAKCDAVATGEEGIVAYNKSVEVKQPYDIILLDIAMPGLSGLDVLKAIRLKEETRGIEIGYGVPIIMVTAYKEPFADAFNNGCDDYILKPIDPDKLLKKINERLTQTSK